MIGRSPAEAGIAAPRNEPGTHDHRPLRMSTISRPVFMGSVFAAPR
jgi:hypothetical protein